MHHGPSSTSNSPRLLRSSTVVALGLGVAGVGTLVMLAAGARIYSPDTYAVFATWWTTATLLGLTFGAMEVYLARQTIAATAREGNPGPVVGYLTGITLAAVVATWLILALAQGWLADRLFGGSRSAVGLLGLFVLLTAAQALFRGVATARQQFPAIGLQLSSDGALRAVLAVAGAWLSPEQVELSLMGVCTAAGLSIVVGGRLCPAWYRRPRLRGGGISLGPLGLLLVSVFGALLVNNASVPWLAATESVGPTVIGAFAVALTLSRMPTQFLSAAFGPLMARLATHLDEGTLSEYRRTQRRSRQLSFTLGALFVLAFTVLGPLAIRVLLGPHYTLPVWVLTALAAASALMFVAAVEQAGLVAASRWIAVAAPWALAAGAFAATLLAPWEQLTRAALAPLISAAVAVAGLWFALRRTIPVSGAAEVDPPGTWV